MNFIISLSIYFLITCQISISSETPKFCSMIDSPDVKLLHIVCLTGIICSSTYVSHVVLKKWYNLILIFFSPRHPYPWILTDVRNLHCMSQFCFVLRCILTTGFIYQTLNQKTSSFYNMIVQMNSPYTNNFLYSWSVVQIIKIRP